MRNKKYTVVGYYADTDQRYLSHFMAKSGVEAEKAAIGSSSGNLCVVASFSGHLLDECRLTKVRYK